jgi:hypothetical protein
VPFPLGGLAYRQGEYVEKMIYVLRKIEIEEMEIMQLRNELQQLSSRLSGGSTYIGNTTAIEPGNTTVMATSTAVMTGTVRARTRSDASCRSLNDWCFISSLAMGDTSLKLSYRLHELGSPIQPHVSPPPPPPSVLTI